MARLPVSIRPVLGPMTWTTKTASGSSYHLNGNLIAGTTFAKLKVNTPLVTYFPNRQKEPFGASTLW